MTKKQQLIDLLKDIEEISEGKAGYRIDYEKDTWTISSLVCMLQGTVEAPEEVENPASTFEEIIGSICYSATEFKDIVKVFEYILTKPEMKDKSIDKEKIISSFKRVIRFGVHILEKDTSCIYVDADFFGLELKNKNASKIWSRLSSLISRFSDCYLNIMNGEWPEVEQLITEFCKPLPMKVEEDYEVFIES